mgnify:CR=1 FL=1
MSIVDGLRAWLNGYEGLAGGRINVDCLPAELASYSLDSDPSYTVTTYMDGTQTAERTYVISSREAIGDDIAQNAANLEWYDNLAAWIRRQRRTRNWPDIGKGRTVSNISVVSTPHPFGVNEDGKARYQIQIKLNYYEE